MSTRLAVHHDGMDERLTLARVIRVKSPTNQDHYAPGQEKVSDM